MNVAVCPTFAITLEGFVVLTAGRIVALDEASASAPSSSVTKIV